MGGNFLAPRVLELDASLRAPRERHHVAAVGPDTRGRLDGVRAGRHQRRAVHVHALRQQRDDRRPRDEAARSGRVVADETALALRERLPARERHGHARLRLRTVAVVRTCAAGRPRRGAAPLARDAVGARHARARRDARSARAARSRLARCAREPPTTRRRRARRRADLDVPCGRATGRPGCARRLRARSAADSPDARGARAPRARLRTPRARCVRTARACLRAPRARCDGAAARRGRAHRGRLVGPTSAGERERRSPHEREAETLHVRRVPRSPRAGPAGG